MESSIALITGLVVFAASIVGLVTQLIKRVEKKVDEVHVKVNSRMEEAIQQSAKILERNETALNRIDQLIDALHAGGIQVPDRPETDPNP